MRNETEMMDLVINFGNGNNDIRVITMEGSRLNVHAPKDQFQDYDITYILSNMNKYIADKSWLDVFGKRFMMQEPEGMSLFQAHLGNWYSFLMIYEDGNKMDLKLVPLNELDEYFKRTDSLKKILLDKDGICPEIAEPSDADYLVKKPSREFVEDSANEFWLLSAYVTKGICRNEKIYAIKHLDLMQNQLLQMISWKVGIETNFSLSVGKSYKYLDKYVTKETWDSIIRTYKKDSIEAMWESLLLCCKLFTEACDFVSHALNYDTTAYGEKMMEYIKGYLPKNIKP